MDKHAKILIVICFLLLVWNYNRKSNILIDKLQHFSISESCPDYGEYASKAHSPFSDGPLHLPFQRPPVQCRTFKSTAVEKVILDMKNKMADSDLFRLFENAYPNTLDTTILWHQKDSETPLTFITTGDIHAEWLRDSARQLSVYQDLVNEDINLKSLIKGAIYQQAKYIIISPYCNAFHPPPQANIDKRPSAIDDVYPLPNWEHVFECKWELDSLASFLTLTNDYIENSKDLSILKNSEWKLAIQIILKVIKREMSPTYDEDGNLNPFYYTFQRETKIGTETLPLSGSGNPVNFGTGLIRSAFRPSDDATIYQLFIPANAQMAVELERLSKVIISNQMSDIVNAANKMHEIAQGIKNGIEQHAIVDHKIFGKVYAYEVDGFGSVNFMDDANIPSLLSLPDMGFGSINDEIYQNTRKMVLSKQGNPYYFQGKYLSGIGGPHVGLLHIWPMSLLVQIRTSNDDDEILELLEKIKTTTGGLGLMHEGINLNSKNGEYFTRSWFSWCNSEFAKTILDLAKRKPHLIFHKDSFSS